VVPRLPPLALGARGSCEFRFFSDYGTKRDGLAFVLDRVDERAGQEPRIASNPPGGQRKSGFDERDAFGGEFPQLNFTGFLGLECFHGVAITILRSRRSMA